VREHLLRRPFRENIAGIAHHVRKNVVAAEPGALGIGRVQGADQSRLKLAARRMG
jgi:hypothetical protein